MQEQERASRKIKQGVVVSTKMQKTVIVKVERTMRHAQYGKVVRRAKKYYAHHEGRPLNVGDKVTIIETRPLSKLKRWRIEESKV